MLKLEKRVLSFLEEHIIWVFFIGVSLIGFFIRLSLRWNLSGDLECFLLPWYETIKEGGGFASLSQQVGNYGILYQTIIAFMTYLPLPAVYSYKIFSCIFDYLLAGSAAALVWELTKEKKASLSGCSSVYFPTLATYSAVLLSPLVWLNSAAWGQCDSIYVSFILLSLLFLLKDRPLPAFIFLGLSFCFKLQFVFIIPFYLFYYFKKKTFSILNFLIIPATLVVSGIPGFLFGRSLGDVFSIYFNQAQEYPSMYLNYPSFWAILGNDYETMKTPAILFTLFLLAAIMFFFILEKAPLTIENSLYLAFLTSLTMVFFLPSMHERYGYLYEVLALLIACFNKRTIPFCVALLTSSVIAYGNYLFHSGVSLHLGSFINLAAYVCYMVLITREIRFSKSKTTTPF